MGGASLWIPPELIVGCRVCASRYELVKLLPRGRVAEVGTNRGDFAKHILAHCDPTELHLVDIEFSLFDPAVGEDKRVTLHKGLSHEVLAGFPDASFEWIYIDADHAEAAVARDARAAADKVKPGGFMVFNDFAHMDPQLGAYGVHRAVVQFAVEERWRFVWLAYDPFALYDVALQRATVD
jgi:predicted O-methyltransferase YrrM